MVVDEHHGYRKTFSLPSALTINTFNSMSYIKLPLTANIKERSRVQGFFIVIKKNIEDLFHTSGYAPIPS